MNTDTQKKYISIDLAKCVPCVGMVCIGICPPGILEIGKDKKPQIGEITECTRCGICADLCPTKAITLISIKSDKK
jgi:ferredoxin